MKINKLCKNICLFLFALIICFCCFSKIETKNVSAGSTDFSVKVTCSNSITNGIYMTYGSTFTFNISTDYSGKAKKPNITVWYRTNNRTAVSQLGDYSGLPESSTRKVVLTSYNSCQSVSVSTKNTKYGVNGFSNLFEFEIYKVEADTDGVTVTIDQSNNKCICSTNANYNYSTATSSGGSTVFNQYNSRDKVSIDEIDRGSDSVAKIYDFWEYYTVYPSLMSSWYNNYVATGLATMAIGGEFYVDCTHTFDWDDDEFVLKFMTSGTDDKTIFILFDRDDKKFDYTQYYLGEFTSCKNGSTKYSVSGRGAYSTYYTIPENVAKNKKYVVRAEGYDTCKCKFYDIDIGQILLDVTQPNIIDWAIDCNIDSSDDYVYVYARFNEPVNVLNNNMRLVCYLDAGKSDRTQTYFEYVPTPSGTYSDTLQFRCKVSNMMNDNTKTLNPDAVYPDRIEATSGSVNVKDFGLGTSSTANSMKNYTARKALNATLKVNSSELGKNNLDLRVPSVTVKQYFSSVIGKKNTGILQITRASNDATIYYCWSDQSTPFTFSKTIGKTDEELSQKYPYKQLNTSSSSSDNVVSFSSDGVLNGNKYLHVLIQSPLKRDSGDIVIGSNNNGPIQFDNTAPVINSTVISPNTFVNKTFTFDVTDGPSVPSSQLSCSSGVESVMMYYTTDIMSYTRAVREGKIDTNMKSSEIYNAQSLTNKMVYNSSNGKYTMALSASDSFIKLEENQYNTYYIAFQFIDKAGNKSPIEELSFHTLQFDRRNLFETSVEYDHTPIVESDDDFSYAFDSNNNVKFTVSKKTVDAGNLSILNLTKDGVNVPTSDVLTVNSANNQKIEFTFKKNLVGLYEIVFGYDVKISNTFRFYFTTSLDNPTYNKTEIDSHGELINYVYQLKDYNFYFKDAYEAVVLEPYSNTTYAPTFSSYDAAYNYVLFNEYKDLSIYHVETQAWADTLRNRNSADRMLALSETHDPQVGDYYIRYKKVDWKVGDQTKSNWVYYYYPEYSPVINIGALSEGLQTALRTVSTTIVNNGGYKFLTGGDLDSDGAPKLIPAQYHAVDETTNVTKCGNTLSPTPTFTGDVGIYSSNVLVDGEDLRLLSNYKFKFNPDTMIFYRKRDTGSYIKMNFLDNQLKALTKATGVYEVIEIDKSGVNHFEVYVDATAPVIQVSTVKRDDAEEGSEIDNPPQEINAEFDGKTFSAKEFNFTGIIETDPYAYIAVYKVEAVTTFLYKVFRTSDIEELKASITDGNYILKIYDRSGNNYQINAKAMSTSLKVNIIEYANNNIKVECNRDKRDIQFYQVECNGNVVASLENYEKTLTFKDNGVYNIHIIDWFGDEYTGNYVFERSLPDIEWHYQKGQFSYVFDSSKSQPGMSMRIIDNKHYEISTNGILTLYYSSRSRYNVEFLCDEDQIPDTQKGTDSLGNNYVKIKTDESYSVKLSYIEYPDIYVIYDVFFDDRSPQINVSIDEHGYLQSEEEEISEFIYNAIDYPELIDPSLDGTEYIPNSITFVPSGEILTHYIASNAKVSSNFIKVSLFDESIAVKCEVYIDNALFQTYEDPKGITEFVLSRSGNYLIRAYDALQNMSEFTFINSLDSYINVEVDGKDCTGKEYSYGNQKFEFAVSEYGTVVFLIKTNEISKYYRFEIDSNGVVRYKVLYNSDVASDIEINLEEKIYSEGSDKTFDIGKDDGLDFKFKYENGKYIFVLNTDELNDYDIEYKFYNNSVAPYYGKCYLSKAKTNIDVEVNGSIVNTGKESIYTKEWFSIPDPSNNNKIVSVYVKHHGIEDCIYSKETGYRLFDYEDEASYTICIENIYGIVNEVTAVISKSFIVEKYVTLLDETTYYYETDYANTIYSNNAVKLLIYSENVTIDARKDGRNFVCKTSTVDNCIQIDLQGEGIYSFVIADKYGNSKSVEVEIKNVALTFIDSIIYGEKNNGILRNEGYTNERLSIDAEKVAINNIAYIGIKNGDSIYPLLDNIAQHPVDNSSEYLHAIGKNGTGIYTVIIRDKYGNAATYDVHYREETTLMLYKTTRNDGIFTLIDIESAINEEGFDGFYTNNLFKFDTDSTNYVFRIDGSNAELITLLEFAQGIDRGSFEYEIYYLDEYGFEYSFVAHLYRGEVTCVANNIEEFYTNNTIPTTTKNFSLTYTSGAKCTYELGGKTFDYYEGDILSKDGRYTFTVEDRAGNITSVVYKKDSICEFSFVDAISGKKLGNGDVANNSKVSFIPENGDSAYVASVFVDGIKLESFNQNSFTVSGHYETLIKDDFGNAAYYEFYILTHSLRGFEYTTPYTYKVTKLEYTNDLGYKVSVLGYVNQFDDHSYFAFGSDDENLILTEDGKYEVTMYSTIYGEYSTFTFSIDNVSPNVELVGCSDGESTLNTVTIKNYNIGDTIKVYKDGELIKTTKILSGSTETPEISEGGDYVIEIINEAGNVQTLSFTRIHVSNVAGSTLVIVLAVAIIVVLFIGLVYRTKSKSDK